MPSYITVTCNHYRTVMVLTVHEMAHYISVIPNENDALTINHSCMAINCISDDKIWDHYSNVYWLVGRYRHFERAYCLQLWGQTEFELSELKNHCAPLKCW